MKTTGFDWRRVMSLTMNEDLFRAMEDGIVMWVERAGIHMKAKITQLRVDDSNPWLMVTFKCESDDMTISIELPFDGKLQVREVGE